MTMNTLPNFCRVCLKYDKNLIDLAHIENEPSETLMSKLQLCVAEVEWTVYKPLLCHPCIKRLNIAYSFKKQCVQSATVLKNYLELVKESQKKNESQNAVKAESILPTAGGAYMLLPNQKYVKILVGGQNQSANTFQNVFLNLIPATTLNSTTPTDNTKNKDTNQNVFLNLNNTFQKFIPLTTAVEAPKKIDIPKPLILNVNQLLTESKSEELSVEIDPTVFGLEEDEESNEEEEENNDYDEVISQAKITLKDFKSNGEKTQNGKDDHGKHYVPILPKHQQQQQEDFVTSGQHFLFSSTENSSTFGCESCQKTFTSRKLLKSHIKDFHLGKMPFKCEYCYTEFATRGEYDFCVKWHGVDSDALNKSLTLRDFTNASGGSPSLCNLSQSDVEANVSVSENGEYICDVCSRPFNSSTGLLRHKVRKHNQKNKKKYFIKGMKNAKCDICNREFSTQSYMQLHRKLHLRDDIGYKYKVFGKSKYGDNENLQKEDKEKILKDKKPKIDMETKQNGSVKNEEDSSSNDANPKEKSSDRDPLDLENPPSVEVKMDVDEENSDSNNVPETEENSSQNSSQGENRDTDEPMSEEN